MGLFENLANIAGGFFRSGGAEDRRRDWHEWDQERKNASIDQFAQTGDIAPDFKKADSPVARAYLTSFLTGTNPAGIISMAPDANKRRADAQSQFDRMTGGWKALQYEDQAAQADDSRFKLKGRAEVSSPNIRKAENANARQEWLKERPWLIPER